MSKPNFDERFPSMFQPGGEAPGLPIWVPAANKVEVSGTDSAEIGASAGNPQEQDPLTGPARKNENAAQTALPQNPSTQDPPVPSPQEQQPQPWQPLLWISALAASALMLAAGVFALTAQYWLPSSMEMDPSKFQGIQLQPWGQVIFAAAPPLLGTGIGIPAALLFLASRRKAAWEKALRTTFAVVAAVVGTASWIGLFATVMFPEAALRWAGGGSRGLALPWTYLVSFSGTWLLSVAVLMLAVLFVVPRRWRQPVPEHAMTDDAGEPAPVDDDTQYNDANYPGENPPGWRPATAGPSPVRGLWFGAAMVAAGMFAMFAPYMFPLATGTVVVELGDGRQTTHQDWAVSAQNLVTPLLLAGFVVMGWALVHVATRPRRRPAAQLEGSDVEL